MKLKPGKRYRINSAGHKFDGRVGTLESVNNGEAWLMVNGKLARVQAQRITDRNVVQADISALRFRPEIQLAWMEGEQFA